MAIARHVSVVGTARVLEAHQPRRAHPVGAGVDRRLAVAEPELQLVIAAHPGKEVVAVQVTDVLRPFRPVEDRGSSGDLLVEVDRAGRVAGRGQAEARPVVRQLHVHEEARAEDMVVLELEQAVGP